MQEAVTDQKVPSQAQFDTWMNSLPEHVAEVVRAHSPFVPHRLKATGQTVFIARFQEDESSEKDVKLSVVAPRAANPAQAGDLAFDGIDPDDLYTLAS